MKTKLSPTQLATLDWMRSNGGILERWHGGFWTVPGMTFKDHPGYRVPDRYVSTGTVHSLVMRGAIEITKRQERDKFMIEVKLSPTWM